MYQQKVARNSHTKIFKEYSAYILATYELGMMRGEEVWLDLVTASSPHTITTWMGRMTIRLERSITQRGILLDPESTCEPAESIVDPMYPHHI